MGVWRAIVVGDLAYVLIMSVVVPVMIWNIRRVWQEWCYEVLQHW